MGFMAFYKILYWQNIPSQIKVWDDFDEIKIELPQRFMVKIDQAAKEKGLTGNEDYLAQWNWSDEVEIDGEPSEVAEKIKSELEEKYK